MGGRGVLSVVVVVAKWVSPAANRLSDSFSIGLLLSAVLGCVTPRPELGFNFDDFN